MGEAESIATDRGQILAFEFIAIGKRDRMYHDVQSIPVLAQLTQQERIQGRPFKLLFRTTTAKVILPFIADRMRTGLQPHRHHPVHPAPAPAGGRAVQQLAIQMERTEQAGLPDRRPVGGGHRGRLCRRRIRARRGQEDRTLALYIRI